jgi:CDP-4-dehydro-6-deoxyglucose reductase/ferredoxin-NAD(P)+ reductase (naphthalene dioxygenase ferredoxin-specific)
MRREALMARSPKTFQVTIRNSGQTIACATDRTILQAAIAAGVDYPYACATGNCATCVSKLENGKVSLLPHSDAALGKVQLKSGLTLACRARPRSDVTVNWLARAGS